MQLEQEQDQLLIKSEDAKVQIKNFEVEMKLQQQSLINSEKINDFLTNLQQFWTQAESELDTVQELAIGNALICTGVISYLANYNAQVRSEAILRWQELLKEYGIPFDAHISLKKYWRLT